jgi:hypothetical protein
MKENVIGAAYSKQGKINIKIEKLKAVDLSKDVGVGAKDNVKMYHVVCKY